MAQASGSNVPDMGRRQFMNLLAFGAVTGTAIGGLYPVIKFFIPASSGGSGGGGSGGSGRGGYTSSSWGYDDDDDDREILHWSDIAEDLGWPHPDTGYDPWSD